VRVFAGLTGTIAQSRDLEPVFPGNWLWRSPGLGRALLRVGIALKAPLIPVRRWMKKENPTDGIDFAKRLESARMTFR
jgi:hypothetical protein